MTITKRGWALIFTSSFLTGALFPWESLPWN